MEDVKMAKKKEKETISLAQQKIDKIISLPPLTSRRMAEDYLKRRSPEPIDDLLREALPLMKICGDKVIEEMQNMCEYDQEEAKKKLNPETINELTSNYDKKTIARIIWALLDFEDLSRKKAFFTEDVWKDNNERRELYRQLQRRTREEIKASDVLLPAALTASEKETISAIKSRFEERLKRLSQIKEIEIDPVKEILIGQGREIPLNLVADALSDKPSMSSADWDREYQFYLGRFVFKKRRSRPEKIIDNALLIVIYTLLDKDGKQIKWRRSLTADIVSQYFKKEIKVKDVDNAVNSTR